MLTSGPLVRSAIEKDRLVPVFQPIIDLRTGLVAGFEVLARWKHTRRGLILPANFIQLAEQQGLIGLLSENVLRRAFIAASRSMPQQMLSINISPLQLRNRALPLWLRELCRETGWPPDQLTIEITETAIIDNIDTASRIVADLKVMGCRLALDDFGTGYSSLINLQALPFDELKVDRSFVHEMTKKRESRKIVGAVMELAHNLGISTVAEGVETQQQCEMLIRLGCHAGQGWLYGKPLPANQLLDSTECPMHAKCGSACTRHLDQQALRVQAASELAAQLKALYNGAPVGLCLLDRHMRYMSINPFLAEINGVPEHEHLGRTPREMVPDIFPAIEPHIRAALEGKPPSHLELTRRGPGDGILRTISLNYAPVYDEAAEVIGVSVAAVDVTEHTRAEQALRARVEYYKGFLEQSQLAPWLADAVMNVLEVSPKWIVLTGMNEEQSLGTGWLQALHPDDIASCSNTVVRALRILQPFEVQYRVRTKMGEWRWARSKGWPLFSPEAEVVGWCGYLVDVEEHKLETEQMLARLDQLTDGQTAGGLAAN
jgi:PAS domain S-box-containing protein